MEEKVVIWKRIADYSSVEHCLVTATTADIAVSSTIGGMVNDLPFEVNYSLLLDSGWNAKEVYIECVTDNMPLSWHFVKMPVGWLGGNSPEPVHCDCVDVDITMTPFTNSLPINRLKLQPGQTTQIEVLYFDVLERNFTAEKQVYTCIDERTYKFENADGSFSAELVIDADGIVTNYPGLFERLYSYTQ
ncbi:putative glycolipid-binding domain-containing protein [Mucilaginibacter sp. UR6-1]|uniref:putative glycolipid-binding domain-containing protein n=1 Tax=Mucilaginibacter sp. UR6-1 TaxID=1435643 RepID=UPI001E2F6A9D|nr:putative glycolipid-binding domain-containing protein [Mucilaginibacter sp. UR6-1]MCC8410333.1 putative glycolipid-binding domain-containing protein [Mucilaginibacter sp. UR6-1]